MQGGPGNTIKRSVVDTINGGKGDDVIVTTSGHIKKVVTGDLVTTITLSSGDAEPKGGDGDDTIQ